MATLAADSRTATRSSASAPISSHPLFPAIVALWFAALLGLGSLILPTILLERLVTVTGLASLVPQAAPPLGFTARAILALGAGALGATLGLVLARQIADSHTPRPKARFSSGEARPRRPISAHDELGEEGLGTEPVIAAGQKRRSLAIAEDNRRSEYLQHAPLPGQDSAPPPELDAIEEALELGEFATSEDMDPDYDQDETMTEAPDFRPEHELADEAEGGQRQDSETFDQDDAPPQGEALPFTAPSLRRQQEMPGFLSAQFDLDEDEQVEPYIAPGTFGTPARHAERPFGDAPAEPAEPRFTVVEPEPITAALVAAVDDDRPLDDLGLVQLAARLGASLERRRAQRAAASSASPAAPVFTASPEDFAAAEADEAAAARASFFAAAGNNASDTEAFGPEFGPEPDEFDVGEGPAAPLLATKPVGLRGLSFDEETDYEESDYAASLSLPRQVQAGSAEENLGEYDEAEDSFEDEFDEESEADEDIEYSSLLAMKNPFQKKAEFVRIDEPEPDEDDGFEATVTFPSAPQGLPEAGRRFDPPASTRASSAAGDPGDAERELRAALATLQRMSGAA